jgi:hypothetical protein
MNKRKNYIFVNEGFTCEKCGEKNPAQKGGCRNHCRKCLYSKHVDKEVPGDRESTCLGLMEPFEVDLSGKKGYIIMHKCKKCGKIINNKCAPDDDFDAIIKLSTRKMI